MLATVSTRLQQLLPDSAAATRGLLPSANGAGLLLDVMRLSEDSQLDILPVRTAGPA